VNKPSSQVPDQKGPRERAFFEFHRDTGLKPFGPEFTSSLIATMRRSRCHSERIYAWHRWRAWGNSSKYPVTHWDKTRAALLDQIDCAVELEWFREGRTVESVINAAPEERETARKQMESRKGRYSRCHARLRQQGRLAFDGQRYYAVISPDATPEPAKNDSSVAVTGNWNDLSYSFYSTDKNYLQWMGSADAPVAVTGNWEALEKARNARAEAEKQIRNALKAVRNDYRNYLQRATGGEPDLIVCNPLNSSNVSLSVCPVEEARQTDRQEDLRPPSPEEDQPTGREAEIHELLVETLEAKLPGEVPGPTLCKRIDAKLRDAPLPLLRKRIELRLSKITSMGMVESLAHDVAKSWSARKRGPWDSPVDPMEEENIRTWQEWVLPNSKASPEWQQEAREQLEKRGLLKVAVD
jgi:hypothetical protein